MSLLTCRCRTQWFVTWVAGCREQPASPFQAAVALSAALPVRLGKVAPPMACRPAISFLWFIAGRLPADACSVCGWSRPIDGVTAADVRKAVRA